MQIDLLACFEYCMTVPTFAQQLTTGTTAVKFFSSPVGGRENMASERRRADHAADAAADQEACTASYRYTEHYVGRPGADQGKMPSNFAAFRAWAF